MLHHVAVQLMACLVPLPAVLGGRIVPPAPVALPAFPLLTALIRPLLPLFAHAIGPIAVVVATTAVGPVLL